MALVMTALLVPLPVSIAHPAGITVTVTMPSAGKIDRSSGNAADRGIFAHRDTVATMVPQEDSKANDVLSGSAQKKIDARFYVSDCATVSVANSLNTEAGSNARLWFRAPAFLIAEDSKIALDVSSQ